MHIKMPRINIVAKPRTWSVPIAYKTIAVINVVTLASTIVRDARSNPCRTAKRNLAPFTNSSRMRSKMSTFASTLIPTVNTKPAKPGSVSGAEIKIINA